MHTVKSLKAKNHIVFLYNKEIFKKIFCFVLMSRITNLYIKRIPDIKKVVLL